MNEQINGSEREPDDEAAGTPERVILVAGDSRVNRVVVCRIVERMGLHTVSAPCDEAVRSLAKLMPVTVIVDSGSENGDCEALLGSLATLRQANDGRPAVVLLSTTKVDVSDSPMLGFVDAVVPKPILPELLQPVIERLLPG